MVSKVEDNNAFGRFLPGVPRRESPQSTGDKPGFGDAKEKASEHEDTVALLKGLEGADSAKEEELKSEPLSRADPVEDHVGRNFGEDNAEREHLLADIELVLVDTDITHEVVRDSIGNVSAVKLWEADKSGWMHMCKTRIRGDKVTKMHEDDVVWCKL